MVYEVSPPLRDSPGLDVDGEPLRSASSPPAPPPPPLRRVSPPVDAIACELCYRPPILRLVSGVVDIVSGEETWVIVGITGLGDVDGGG